MSQELGDSLIASTCTFTPITRQSFRVSYTYHDLSVLDLYDFIEVCFISLIRAVSSLYGSAFLRAFGWRYGFFTSSIANNPRLIRTCAESLFKFSYSKTHVSILGQLLLLGGIRIPAMRWHSNSGNSETAPFEIDKTSGVDVFRNLDNRSPAVHFFGIYLKAQIGLYITLRSNGRTCSYSKECNNSYETRIKHFISDLNSAVHARFFI